MRSPLPNTLEAGRITRGPFASDRSHGGNGQFFISGPCGARLGIQAADCAHMEAMGWEHVSVKAHVSRSKTRVPNWVEMCFVKNLFWDYDVWVVQFHPSNEDYVNNHPHVLHLWRYVFGFPTPPKILV